MKFFIPKLLLLNALAVSVSFGQIVVNNDFSSVTPGSYSGGTAPSGGIASFDGAALGASSALGNASGNRSTTVGATIGVNGGAGATNSDMVMRSRSTADLTTTTSFSVYFLYEGSTTNNSSFVGLGWGRASGLASGNDASGIDGNNPFNVGQNNRFQFGLAKTGVQDGAQLAVMGQFNSPTILTGSGSDVLSATLSANNWYQLSGDITFNSDGSNSTFDVSNIAVRNWGADGITGGSSIMSLSSQTGINASFGSNFDNDSNGYAILTGNAGRGVDTFDNFVVTAAIPEPSTYAALAGLMALGLVAWRRRR